VESPAEQLWLNWGAPASDNAPPSSANAPAAAADVDWRRRQALRRAVLRWLLATEKPAGAAVDTITRLSKLKADIAAFWSRPVRNPHDEGPGQLWQPARTAIVQCFLSREECWPDWSRSAELAPRLRDLKLRLHQLEEQIRTEEPELRDGDALFDEYAQWRYEDSGNREYHHVRRDIEKTEQALYRGTQFERIRQAALADQLYLAVPAGLIQPEELANGWGLLWVAEDLTVTVAAQPESRECHPENRLHLVQNIAAAGTGAVLFAMGLRAQNDGTLQFVQPPRGHRRPQGLTLTGG